MAIRKPVLGATAVQFMDDDTTYSMKTFQRTYTYGQAKSVKNLPSFLKTLGVKHAVHKLNFRKMQEGQPGYPDTWVVTVYTLEDV